MNLLLKPVAALFKGRHFDQDILILCVRWYVTYKLSYRDLANMMAERGIAVAPDQAHPMYLRDHVALTVEQRRARNQAATEQS